MRWGQFSDRVAGHSPAHRRRLRRVTDRFTDTKSSAAQRTAGLLSVLPLVGFEPTTASSVKRALYPLSYSAMHRES